MVADEYPSAGTQTDDGPHPGVGSPHVFEHEWKQPIVEDGVVRYELQPDGPDGSATLLRFSHRGLGVRSAGGFLGGTHAFLDRLESHLAAEPLPDWLTRRLEIITEGETP